MTENNVTLIKPSEVYKDSYLKFYKEWKESGEDIVPWVVEKDPTDFSEMLNWLRSQQSNDGLPANMVPSSTFWLIDENENVVAAVNIRHTLNDRLFNSGGHIGYGVAPSHRRKGFAKKMLTLALKEARLLGIDDVLVVCEKSNIGSEKTIIANGGRLDNEYIEPDGCILRRFWIKK